MKYWDIQQKLKESTTFTVNNKRVFLEFVNMFNVNCELDVCDKCTQTDICDKCIIVI